MRQSPDHPVQALDRGEPPLDQSRRGGWSLGWGFGPPAVRTACEPPCAASRAFVPQGSWVCQKQSCCAPLPRSQSRGNHQLSRWRCRLFHRLPPPMRINEQCGQWDTHTGKICEPRENALTVTKKNPGQSRLPGLLQVVASACRLLWSGRRGVGGWGCRPDRGLSTQTFQAKPLRVQLWLRSRPRSLPHFTFFLRR